MKELTIIRPAHKTKLCLILTKRAVDVTMLFWFLFYFTLSELVIDLFCPFSLVFEIIFFLIWESKISFHRFRKFEILNYLFVLFLINFIQNALSIYCTNSLCLFPIKLCFSIILFFFACFVSRFFGSYKLSHEKKKLA